jgi:uncharacterized protein YneF (UPF0154 family)
MIGEAVTFTIGIVVIALVILVGVLLGKKLIREIMRVNLRD